MAEDLEFIESLKGLPHFDGRPTYISSAMVGRLSAQLKGPKRNRKKIGSFVYNFKGYIVVQFLK